MATYSFMDVSATLTGAAGVIDLGFGSASAKEGITISLANPRNSMTIGADGGGMHSLRCDKSGTVTVRLLQTSSRNALLQAMYDAQAISSSAWGNNVLTIVNAGNNETTVCRGVAFQKQPDRTYAEDGGTVEWVFDCITIDTVTGTYAEA
ncbi:MAG: DUF3277 family protein [Sutterellaceae bacterium]|nr:DUF3277 family protein [Sutterellaceae bacterium]MDD7442877.1 DUF3277 family protein [Sutterellaceae bacterium]MDY2868022.1 phage protein [Mesosutterella sp.]